MTIIIPITPDQMTDEERQEEIINLLATGFLRYRQKQQEKARAEKVCLDLSPTQSVHGVSSTTKNIGECQ
ncbi:hypothetical protein ACQZV8_07465 [Magnetococcales bacterium HHB-1]